MHNFVMIMAALAVGGSIVGTLAWFFRRLRAIEEEDGIVHPHETLREAFDDLMLRIRNRARRG